MVWVKPDHLMVSQPFWINERANLFFVLQKRKAQGKGLGSLFVATIDSVFDTKSLPFRIIYHYDGDDLSISTVVAVALNSSEIQTHWDYLEKNVLPVLAKFETEAEAREFVMTKVESLLEAEKNKKQSSETEVSKDLVLHKFHKIFDLPTEEKLVNYYAGTYWKGRTPFQGKLYFSVNFLCFYSFLVGKQTKIQIRWTEITKLEKNAPLLFPQTFTVVTRSETYDFSLLVSFKEAFKLASQLANMAMKQNAELRVCGPRY
ncbi:unnamed protein product [Bursaphelenchus xylophilus]|uniref:(pine wood nematode) hypothetical protein n=1 Tax=Bursaphelenchus xylophilus TaxID=6326 RepID=A0A1I7S3P8_BURXY|nr:unnamed protein product [Bursaphelenchus xylophilus]CAG9116451.1 unnamed protein product [Bursaphelenchus xylophilus]